MHPTFYEVVPEMAVLNWPGYAAVPRCDNWEYGWPADFKRSGALEGEWRGHLSWADKGSRGMSFAGTLYLVRDSGLKLTLAWDLQS